MTEALTVPSLCGVPGPLLCFKYNYPNNFYYIEENKRYTLSLSRRQTSGCWINIVSAFKSGLDSPFSYLLRRTLCHGHSYQQSCINWVLYSPPVGRITSSRLLCILVNVTYLYSFVKKYLISFSYRDVNLS